ncbi:hypothetical protein NQ314_005147 [Rhamnusium bicolor]|uniref:DDE Tnp4 domain-containing protein n=1 Tax=Rhamnusium bicolor TaxID=1586634 RepID=A0AAV8ZK54_9CUCU|nr:hypothetical protein NQ314_005147 [Rhamnusium bicolor]
MLPIFHQLLRRQRNNRLRRQREEMRSECDPFDLPDNRFKELFRLNKELVRGLIQLLHPCLEQPSLRRGITVDAKIFCALRFYATGSYQRSCGEEWNLGFSQTSVHRAIREVTTAIEYLLTPFRNPVPNSPESRYNIAHVRARNCIERTFGLLKMRFRCLLKERTARYNPNFVANLVKACAVLHNMCIRERIPININDNEDNQEQYEENQQINAEPEHGQQGILKRQRIVEDYFQ